MVINEMRITTRINLKGKNEMGKVVNDFTINIATANGTGSQSANLILLQSIFDMGINISGKNLFPSNISGLPTWYILRISDNGYQAPGDVTNIQVLVNKDTWEADLGSVEPGTVVIWNSDAKMAMDREDVISYPVPMTKMARTLNPKLAKLVTNIIYVGVLAEMLGIEQGALESAVEKQFSGKASAIELNTKALSLGRDYAKDELEKQDEFVLEARVRDQKQFFIEGNEAAALGAIYGEFNSLHGIQLLHLHHLLKGSSIGFLNLEEMMMEATIVQLYKPKMNWLRLV